jgi:hypothetical protein
MATQRRVAVGSVGTGETSFRRHVDGHHSSPRQDTARQVTLSSCSSLYAARDAKPSVMALRTNGSRRCRCSQRDADPLRARLLSARTAADAATPPPPHLQQPCRDGGVERECSGVHAPTHRTAATRCICARTVHSGGRCEVHTLAHIRRSSLFIRQEGALCFYHKPLIARQPSANTHRGYKHTQTHRDKHGTHTQANTQRRGTTTRRGRGSNPPHVDQPRGRHALVTYTNTRRSLDTAIVDHDAWTHATPGEVEGQCTTRASSRFTPAGNC